MFVCVFCLTGDGLAGDNNDDLILLVEATEVVELLAVCASERDVSVVLVGVCVSERVDRVDSVDLLVGV